MKGALTCTKKEYIQSSNYVNNEIPRQEKDIQTSKFIHNIQTGPPKLQRDSENLTRENNPIQMMMINVIAENRSKESSKEFITCKDQKLIDSNSKEN